MINKNLINYARKWKNPSLPKEKTMISPSKLDKDGFEYVPSINLYVAKEKKFYVEAWFDSHKKLKADREKMPTPLEFIEFLKYAKTNLPEIYKDIIEVRKPWKAEWLDADFKFNGKDFIINYHIFDENGNIIKKSEILDKDTLMEDKRISLEDYLYNNHTSQGLPSEKVKSGDLYYGSPLSDNNSVVVFYALLGRAYLVCDGNPSSRSPDRGVRAVKFK